MRTICRPVDSRLVVSVGRALHFVRAIRSQAPQDWRARSDAPYQPGKMRIAGHGIIAVPSSRSPPSPLSSAHAFYRLEALDWQGAGRSGYALVVAEIGRAH